MKKLNIELGNEFLEWNHAWVTYKEQKYPMFQVKVTGSNEQGQQEYTVINDLNQQQICNIHLTSRNLNDVLSFLEANQRARKTFTIAL